MAAPPMDHNGMSGISMEPMSQPKPEHSDMGMMMNTVFVPGTTTLLGALRLRHQAHLAWLMSKWHNSGLTTHHTIDKPSNNPTTQASSFRPT
ncbi:hypothetical protein PtA15_8A131 [Puccinia triticina]|uniref:Uncharacterized protein n=1 Tax=Puccinia triticina TaxID=208348 RepID=A0ABY7CPV9_9BASI|nr:uncharacterized protein PtA15_8A131 [Puccinia triticina]WAQ87229.1 hypothetical protein PtA15_8A131 [Puccinia triticina]WAR57074.1 hypothetical protein PtB15_8B119 [Puccinia triticina]